jgi:hypothetical protein
MHWKPSLSCRFGTIEFWQSMPMAVAKRPATPPV